MISCIAQPFVFIENFNNNQREITANAFTSDEPAVEESSSQALVLYRERAPEAQGRKNSWVFSFKALKNSYVVPGAFLLVANAVEGVARLVLFYCSIVPAIMVRSIEFFCFSRGDEKDYSISQQIADYGMFNGAKFFQKNIPNVFRGVFLCTPFVGHYLTRIFDVVSSKLCSCIVENLPVKKEQCALDDALFGAAPPKTLAEALPILDLSKEEAEDKEKLDQAYETLKKTYLEKLAKAENQRQGFVMGTFQAWLKELETAYEVILKELHNETI